MALHVVTFRLSGPSGHFARAESATSMLSYPLPPRTVIMGLVGAVLGLPKDMPQQVLEPCHIAVAGPVPVSHWHKAKLRKDPPELLPKTVKTSHSATKGTKQRGRVLMSDIHVTGHSEGAKQRAGLITQEWLWKPDYRVWVALPGPYQQALSDRIRERRWHFQPSLGLSEMMADLEYLGDSLAEPMPEGEYPIVSVLPQDQADINAAHALQQGLSLQILSMPRTVTTQRVFSHARYIVENNGRAVRAKTCYAYKVHNEAIVFL